MKITPINNQRTDNVNFKARLEVKIGEDFLNRLAAKDYNLIPANKLARGIEYLKEMAPKMGTEADILTLRSKNSEDLVLDWNNENTTPINNTFSSFNESVSGLFAKMARSIEDKYYYVHRNDLQKQVGVIRSFNTKG